MINDMKNVLNKIAPFIVYKAFTKIFEELNFYL